MIVASLTTYDVVNTVLEAESKTEACRILHNRYNLPLNTSKHLVDAVLSSLMAIDYAVSVTIPNPKR